MDIEVVERKKRKPTSKYRKKRLKEDRDMWVEFGLKKPPVPRYVGLQGVLWFLVSKAVRMADFAKYGGLCVDGCGGKVNRWEDADCGHFQTASRPATRFDPRNLALQLKGCNKAQQEGDVSKPMGFAREIDRRHGEGTADAIIALSKANGQKNLPNEELREQITFYKEKVDNFNKE